MIEKIKKYYSERSNSYSFGGKKHYRPIHFVGATFSFVAYALLSSILFGFSWIVFAIFGGGLTSHDFAPFSPSTKFWIISIMFGILAGASKVFLREIESFETDENFRFSTVRLSKEEERNLNVNRAIEYYKNKHNRPNFRIEKRVLTINYLEQKSANHKEQIKDYPIYIYVLAGLSMFFNWLYKQIGRWLASVSVISLFIIIYMQVTGWRDKDIEGVKQGFVSMGILAYSLMFMSIYLILWLVRAQTKQQYVGGSSYFWKMLDNHKLKKYGISRNEMTNDVKLDELILFGNEITDDVKHDELMLKRLRLQQKSNRKRRART